MIFMCSCKSINEALSLYIPTLTYNRCPIQRLESLEMIYHEQPVVVCSNHQWVTVQVEDHQVWKVLQIEHLTDVT